MSGRIIFAKLSFLPSGASLEKAICKASFGIQAHEQSRRRTFGGSR